MDLHVCKSCGTVTNVEANGRCLTSASGQHAWLTGEPAEDYMQRLWQLRSHAVSHIGSVSSVTIPRA